ncbi:MAG TPA: hypothetical protein VKE98_17725 [Gemmataceae bacterium]|nr:hypothetical protein [Gemmataceae bacterium]
MIFPFVKTFFEKFSNSFPAIRGRSAIEKDESEFFKKNPKATLEVHIDSVRVLNHHTALEVGTLRLRLAGVLVAEILLRGRLCGGRPGPNWRASCVT